MDKNTKEKNKDIIKPYILRHFYPFADKNESLIDYIDLDKTTNIISIIDTHEELNYNNILGSINYHYIIDIKKIFHNDNIVYVIGGAGYGKSLFLKNLSVNPNILEAFSNKPLLIIRGDIKRIIRSDGTFKPMLEYLEECFVNNSLKNPNDLHPDFLRKCLNAGRCLILLDALDEVANDQRNELHSLIITFFKETYPKNKICITSRERGFIPSDNIKCFYIDAITDEDVSEYVDRFIKLGKFNKEEKDRFVSQASILVKKGFIKGFLTLSLLLAIYKNEQELPTNKILLYEKCFDYMANLREKNKKLLLDSSTGTEYDWNALAKLMNDATFMELACLGTPNNIDIPKRDIIESMISLYENRFYNKNQCEESINLFLQFCADRTEVFIPSHSSNNEYKFFHRSFYEYFYAKYIEARTNNAQNTYKELCKFDVDSEIFELLITLYSQRNPQYLRDILAYSFSVAEKLNDGKTIDLLALIMQYVDENDFIERFILFILEKGDLISNLKLSIMFDIISKVISRNIPFFLETFHSKNDCFLLKIQLDIIKIFLQNKKICNDALKRNKNFYIGLDEMKNKPGFTYSKLLLLLPDGHKILDELFMKFTSSKYLISIKLLNNKDLNDIVTFATKVRKLTVQERLRIYDTILFL